MPQNLFKIYDGRNYFWQWDADQKLIVLDETVNEVYFSNKDMKYAITKDVCTDKDGNRVCYIPDVLLTLPKNLIASAYVTDDNEKQTLRSVKFAVRQRALPMDYVVSGGAQFEDFDERLNVIEDIIEYSCLVQKFNTIKDAEKWAQEFKKSGALISVNTGGVWKPCVIEDDYSVAPICNCDEEALIRDINALRQLVGNSSVINQIEQYVLDLKLPDTYDAKGSAVQALADAKEYANNKYDPIGSAKNVQDKLAEEISRAQNEEAAITRGLQQANENIVSTKKDVATNKDNIDKLNDKAHSHENAFVLNGITENDVRKWNDAHNEVDALKSYVGTFNNSDAKTIVEYINEKAESAVSDEIINELDARIEDVENEIDSKLNDLSFVSYNEQELTDEQKARVRDNIGAISEHDVDLTDYAKKDEVPIIPTKISAFENDKGYITQHQSLDGYATEQFVDNNYQHKGNYLTEVPEGYAKTADIPTKPEDIGAQPAGEYVLRSELTASAAIRTVSLLASQWTGDGNLYSQVVSIDGVTDKSQVNLAPSVEQLVIFYEKDLTFVTENDDGVVTVYAIGQKPENDYTIQVTIKEVAV